VEIVTINAAGASARTEYLDGREYLVAPLSLIVPGVLPGSRGPLFYPPSEVYNSAPSWNRVPLTLGHPTQNGQNVSARAAGVLNRLGLGFVKSPSFTQGKLRAEGWFDVQNTRRIAPQVYDSLKAGRPVELSTGLFTDNELAANGSHHNGHQYTHIARNYRPDHVAVLVNEIGACSLRDGCGVLVNRLVRNSSMSDVVDGSCKCGGACKNGKKPGKKKGLPMKVPTGDAVMNTFTANCKATGKPGPCKGWKGVKAGPGAQKSGQPSQATVDKVNAEDKAKGLAGLDTLTKKNKAAKDEVNAADKEKGLAGLDALTKKNQASKDKVNADDKAKALAHLDQLSAEKKVPSTTKPSLSDAQPGKLTREEWSKKWGPAEPQAKVPTGQPKIKGGGVPTGLKKGMKTTIGYDHGFSDDAKKKSAALKGVPTPPAGFKQRMKKKTPVL